MFKVALVAIAGFLFVITATWAAVQMSPWPSVWVIRFIFAQGSRKAAATMAPYVPPSVTALNDQPYAPGEPGALFDIYRPKGAGKLPAIAWIHGGGFVAGDRSDVANYLKILASHGYATVAVGYSRAPGDRFPTPVRQVNLALAHLTEHAAQYGIDPERIVLAGDSAGAQIAAQTALVITEPAHARSLGIAPGLEPDALRATILHCGVYDPRTMDDGQSPFASFRQTVLWSYVGTRNPSPDQIARLAVTPNVTGSFPPSFISVGNADPLAPQSVALADALRTAGTPVETLFFPPDHEPPLGHEYQFDFTTEASQVALKQSLAFLEAHVGTEARPASPNQRAANSTLPLAAGQ